MKAFLSAAKLFLAQIWNDAMLAMLLFVPIFMGQLFRFGVPALEGWLRVKLGAAAILGPYYPVFDLLLAAMTPLMSTAAGAMVILEEADVGLTRAMAASPLGKSGYLASRIAAPAVVSTLYCALILAVFKLSPLSAVMILALALCSGALGVVSALMVPSLAKDKMEGLAVTKLSGLIMLGLPAALLVPAPAQYIAGILPTLWMTRLILGGSFWNVLPSLLSSAFWAAVFYRAFKRRLL